MKLIFEFLVFIAIIKLHASAFEDVSDLPHVFTSLSLPRDNETGEILERYMASVGNGHIATNIRSDTIFVNGLYNGLKGESHRARIPSQNNIIAEPIGSDKYDERYSLDVSLGVFTESFNVSGYNVQVRTFAHRFFIRLMVTQIVVTGAGDGITLKLTSKPGGPSEDISFQQEKNYDHQHACRYSSGLTKLMEDENLEPYLLNATYIYSVVPNTIGVLGSSDEKMVTWSFLGAYDFEMKEASRDFDQAANMIENGKHKELYTMHTEAWLETWNKGRIEVIGDIKLSKVIYGSLYYILSSLPVTETAINGERNQFYGLSPGGLAYGELLRDYQGHSFWDTEIWMYPPFLYLYPETAKEMLNYRLHVLNGARDRANSSGYEGTRYPWESARTGGEVTPDCCPETSNLQIHITGDVAFAIRQYFAITRDYSWLRDKSESKLVNGCRMIREIAEFWQSRASWNETTRNFDIRNVMPPDEDNFGVDNNGYTNIIAGYAIYFAKYAECLCGDQMEPIPEDWMDVAKALKLLYDPELDYHPEYENYELGTIIKQADVVLLGFPLQYAMKDSTKRNNLIIYENVTRRDGPAMTWAMHAIGFLDLNDLEKAEEMFLESYTPYIREPFKVWTEARPPTLGAVNFITGMGGFLQGIISGYGGYRLFPEHVEFRKPRLPLSTTFMMIHGLDYLGNEFDVEIYSQNVTFTLTSKSLYDLYFRDASGNVFPFDQAGTQVFFDSHQENFVVSLQSDVPTNCNLPIDQIGEPLP